MTTARGLFEHADHSTPRPEHGYCTDDNARMLVVTSRQRDAGHAARLSRVALGFVLQAQLPDGRSRNRMDLDGNWTDTAGTEDCWGRGIWGLGVAAAIHGSAQVRQAAAAGFDVGCQQRSPWSRAQAFATLGAAAVCSVDPAHRGAIALLDEMTASIGDLPDSPWRWPEPRLTYANAALAEALISAGAILQRSKALERGLAMLNWLIERETLDGHLSVTGVNGCDVTDAKPQFDQQPIEVAAIADACWCAWTVTRNVAWLDGVRLAVRWFEGSNDADTAMIDPSTDGGFDGLHVDGANANQGAESTLALVSTMQRARQIAAIK